MSNTQLRHLAIGVLFGATVSCVRMLHAQEVRGSVVIPDGLSTVAGVIIVFETVDGHVVRRVLANERGVYTARLPGGVYRVRALRVGFQPTVVPVVTVADTGTTPLVVTLVPVPVRLPSVTVRGTDVCRGQRADGELVAEVWEEARKALLASELSVSDEPLMAEWVEYERTLDAAARTVRAQRSRSTRSATTHAFRSAPWEALARTGYVVDSTDGTVFHAPDAEVLLSDSFASLHCFRVEPSTDEHPNWIGLGFRPVQERRGISDIEGTFWIDRLTNELRTLEYRYTNLPSVTDRVEPGGMVEFLRLKSGSWLVQRWQIRMPQVVQTTATTLRRRNVTVSSSPTMVTAIRVVGGSVLRVKHGDATLFEAEGAAPTFVVRAPQDGTMHSLSVVDIRITMLGTDYEAYTDHRGVARLGPMLPGRYQAMVLTPLMDSLGISSEPVDVIIRDQDQREILLGIPSVLSMLRRQCGDQSTESLGAHLRGVVVNSDGLPVADAAITLSWPRGMAFARDGVSWNALTTTVRSDSAGLWQLCGVPRDAVISVGVETELGRGAQMISVPVTTTFASSRIVVATNVAATNIGATNIGATNIGATNIGATNIGATNIGATNIGATNIGATNIGATNIGTSTLNRSAVVGAAAREVHMIVEVTDSIGQPVVDANVRVTVKGGREMSLRTDSTGRAVAAQSERGMVAVDVRKVGYAGGVIQVTVERGTNTVPIVLGSVAVPRLAVVRIVGNREVNGRHSDFERRHASGEATHSITANDIERRNPVSTWQMLTRVPSIMVVDSAGEFFVKSSRMSTVLCWPRIAIDGRVLSGRPNLGDLPPPSEIYGIEIFAGSARLPVMYGGDGDERYCGLIAIWTK